MAAFQNVYEEYSKPVYKFLLALTCSEDMAEELLQETFYQAFKHIDRFEGKCSLYTWLCCIGKNAWYKELRRRRTRKIESLDDAVLTQTSAEEAIIKKEMYMRIQKAIRELDEPYRDVFILHAVGAVKFKEIAAVYQKSENWARVVYFRAKQRIAQEVSD
ncbi:MAG: RNA polymerase sigma factor [Oscillospiraceae bacterium]|nr:RNA polymerase sigma factor [Oscillospiraceae bacterium]